MNKSITAIVTKIENSIYGPHFKSFTLTTSTGLVQNVLLRDDAFNSDIKIKDTVKCGIYTNLYSSMIESIQTK